MKKRNKSQISALKKGMKKVENTTFQNNRVQTLNQRIIDYYHSLKRRNWIFTAIMIYVLLSCCFFLGYFFYTNNHYTEKVEKYNQQLTALTQKREMILSGEISETSQSFDTILKEKLSGLKDYPNSSNTYEVSIKGTEGKLAINKNNIFVSDNANILDAATKKKIYSLNKQLAASTKGSQFVVVTVNDLPRGSGDIENYANTIFSQLGIGDKTENNGVLYLISLDDRKFRLEVGYGLEGLIPDASADDIINDDDVVAAFKHKEYGKAVNQVIDKVFKIMNTKTALVDSNIKKVNREKRNALFVHVGLCGLLITLLFLSLAFAVNAAMGTKALEKCYLVYQKDLKELAETIGIEDEDIREKMKQTNLYFMMLCSSFLLLSKGSIRRAISRGKLLRDPHAKKMSLGRVLIGDTLYSGDGDVLTHAYLSSSYHSSGSSGGSGGSSWGSFGGGSSGGGGASGGW